MKRSSLLVPASIAFAASLLLFACTGAGDGGMANQQLSRGATWDSDAPPAAGTGQVSIATASGTRTTTCLDVKSAYALDLFSVAFTLQFDPSVLSYTGYQAGTLLGSGNQILVQASPQPAASPDSVVVGITRNAAVVTGGVTANGTLITLCFDLVAPATASPVTFGGASLVGLNSLGTDPNNPLHVAIKPDDFTDGKITVE